MIGKIQKLKNKKGFTLVELIVVIAIIAILTAVIVPLIARYSAQAQYTTLQDAASTISSTANDALSEGNQLSAVKISAIYGKKQKDADGGLQVTVAYGTGSDTLPVTMKATDTEAQIPTSSGNKGVDRVGKRFVESLYATLPEGCSFYVSVSQSAVAGVAYTNASDSAIGSSSPSDLVKNTDFDNAYTLKDGTAVGLSGIYVGQAS